LEHLPTRLGTRQRGDCGFAPHEGAHTHEYTRLGVHVLTPESAQKTCGPYWYAVEYRGMAHTAFRKREHFLQWLEQFGLSLDSELGAEGTGDWISISGSYRVTAHCSYDALFLLEGKRVRHLDNGDYTLGVLERDDDGVVNLHHLNCNLLDRPVFDSAASRELVG
jgi:hypothetical protein